MLGLYQLIQIILLKLKYYLMKIHFLMNINLKILDKFKFTIKLLINKLFKIVWFVIMKVLN